MYLLLLFKVHRLHDIDKASLNIIRFWVVCLGFVPNFQDYHHKKAGTAMWPQHWMGTQHFC